MFRIGEFAVRVGRSPGTVRRWECEGRITVKRTPSGQRYFAESDVRAVLAPGFDRDDRVTLMYCRVSSPGQEDDLVSRVAAMETFCLGVGIAVDEWVTGIGGGLDVKREKFVRVMDRDQGGRVARLVVAHKDRLARFGFDYLEHMAAGNGCEVVVANVESLSPRQELVEDLLAVVHTFSGRLYGLRRYEETLRDELGGRS